MLIKVNIQALPKRRLFRLLQEAGFRVEQTELCFEGRRVGTFNYASGTILGFDLEDDLTDRLLRALSRQPKSSPLRTLVQYLGLGFLLKPNQNLEVTENHPFGLGLFIGPLPKSDTSAYASPSRRGNGSASLEERLRTLNYLVPRRPGRRKPRN